MAIGKQVSVMALSGVSMPLQSFVAKDAASAAAAPLWKRIAVGIGVTYLWFIVAEECARLIFHGGLPI